MSAGNKIYRSLIAVITMALLFLVLTSFPAFGHCDSEDGPIIPLIRSSFEDGNIAPLLKWLSPGDEPEIKELFESVRSLRTQSPEAREIADRLFIETFIRLHRASEGAPYTGIKKAGTILPIIAEVDQSLESGTVDSLADKIAQAVRSRVVEQYQYAAHLREHQDDSVEDGRAFVKAYITYVHFVEGLHDYLTAETHEHGSPDEEGHGY